MPAPTGNVLTYTITPAGCLRVSPLPARVLTGSGPGRFSQIELVANAANPSPVTLTFRPAELEALLNPVPANPLQLNPGQHVTLHIRPLSQLGITARGNFADLNPQFVRTLNVDSEPDPCGDGDLLDVVVES